MIEVALKLVDKAIDLLKRREVQRAELFKNFVEPAWKDLEAVHQNYLTTFRAYIELVSDTARVLDHEHAVFRAIELDSIFSDTMRAKVVEAQRLATKDSRLDDFVRSLLGYLCAAPEAVRPIESDSEESTNRLRRDAPYCKPRQYVKHSLRTAASENEAQDIRRRLAVLHLSSALHGLQNAYCEAMHHYNKLKDELLKPTAF